MALLEQQGYRTNLLPAKSGGRLRAEIHYRHGQLPCRVIDVGNRRLSQWEAVHGKAFDAAFDDELRQFEPDVVFTYPNSPADFQRHARARRHDARIVVSLVDERCLTAPPDALAVYDAALAHGAWQAERHAESTALRPVVLPPPVPEADVVPEAREPVCVTFIHPSYQHGACLLLRLAQQLSLDRPEQPILVLAPGAAESTGEGLIEAGLAAGFDLRQHENILVSEPARNPREVWALTQVLVAPALAHPPVTQVAEALVNGIPPVVGDRAGMDLALNGAGFVLPLPLDYTEETRTALPLTAVEPWIDLVERLCDDESFYAGESERARRAAAALAPAALAPRYAAFFRSVAEGRRYDG